MVCPGQQSSDAASLVELGTHVDSICVSYDREVENIAFFDRKLAVVNVVSFICLDPSRILPVKLASDSSPHLSIICKFAFPSVSCCNPTELVFIVVIETLLTVVCEISIGVVNEARTRRHVGCRAKLIMRPFFGKNG